MDAVEFLNQLYRRYRSDPEYYSYTINLNNMEPVGLVAQVETWAKEHPIKTRKSEFLKLFPNALLESDKLPIIAPCLVEPEFYKKKFEESDCSLNGCNECRRKYWLQEVK